MMAQEITNSMENSYVFLCKLRSLKRKKKQKQREY